MLKKYVRVPFLFLVIVSSAAIIIQWGYFYEKTGGKNDDLSYYENKIEKILSAVNESRRPKNEEDDFPLSIDNQPLNREVMRYIILCGPGSERKSSNPGFCIKGSQFYKSLNKRNFNKIFLPLNAQSSISDLNSIIEMTDEFKIYQKYIKRMIPTNPSPKDLLEVELSYIHMFREKDLIHDRLNNLAECTGDARLFRYYAEKAGIETKYVYTVNLPEYKRVCPETGRPELRPYYNNCSSNNCDLNFIEAEDMGSVRLNGHQAVAVRANSNSKWRIINTSDVPGDAISWATEDVLGKRIFEKSDYREMISSDKKLQIVYFHFRKNGVPFVLEPHFIADIEEDTAFNHEQLMRKYTRGKINALRSCIWPTGKNTLFKFKE